MRNVTEIREHESSVSIRPLSSHLLPSAELVELNRDFEDWTPAQILKWAHNRFGNQLAVTSSFGDAVLAHLAWTTVPGIEVVLLDTGYLFAETLWYAEHAASLFNGNLRIVKQETPLDNLWLDDTDACCHARKVLPLERMLVDRQAWVTGLRRDDSEGRSTAPIIQNDIARNAVKVNPIAKWTEADIDRYTIEHCLPVNPLAGRGFTSIGCWPCTRAPKPGTDARSGRWAGTDKTECGLHFD